MHAQNVPASEPSLSQLRAFAAVIESNIGASSLIFQPNLARRVTVLPYAEAGCCVCAVETRRIKPVDVSFDDLDDFVPAIEDIVTNNLPGFPFDSLHDFVAEINRPVDKVSMASLRFKFSVGDLRYDVEKMKKKKDPQELVDGINCKLTR